MGFKRFFKALGKGVAKAAPIAAGVSQLAGIPMVGSIANAIMIAEERIGAGKGPEKFVAAVDSLSVAAPYIIRDLEQQFGIEIPDEAAEAFVKAQVEAHVALLNSTGVLGKI